MANLTNRMAILTELGLLSQVTSFVNFLYVEPFLRQSVDFQSRLALTVPQQLEANFLFERLVKEYNRKEATGSIQQWEFLLEWNR